jgi:plastocyanin
LLHRRPGFARFRVDEEVSMNMSSRYAVLAAVVLAAGCSQSPSRPSDAGGAAAAADQDARGGGLPLSATVAFGRPDTGSPFPPPQGHDQSSHAKDNLVPRTVVIAKGGTVTFDLSGAGRAVHQVMVFPDGTEPGDVDITALRPSTTPPCPPVPLIADPDGIVLAPQPCAGGTTSPSHTFDQPGRYLVICAFLPHFADFQMYGWVIVK